MKYTTKSIYNEIKRLSESKSKSIQTKLGEKIKCISENLSIIETMYNTNITSVHEVIVLKNISASIFQYNSEYPVIHFT